MAALIQVLIALIVLVITLSAPGRGWQPVEVDGRAGVIVDPSDGDVFGTGSDDYWTPALADIEAAEAAITEAEGDLRHRRQYLGIVVDGTRLVWINGFCNDFGIDWRTRPVLVDDGGDCYFSARFDVTAGELVSFSFNGQG